jgi:hypothetical protein
MYIYIYIYIYLHIHVHILYIYIYIYCCGLHLLTQRPPSQHIPSASVSPQNKLRLDYKLGYTYSTYPRGTPRALAYEPGKKSEAPQPDHVSRKPIVTGRKYLRPLSVTLPALLFYLGFYNNSIFNNSIRYCQFCCCYEIDTVLLEKRNLT